MNKIGIVGGVGWRSTVDYYTEICSRFEGQPSMPELTIESLDLNKAVAWLGNSDDDSWRRFDEYHRLALQRLEAAGAGVALIASNTPHHRYESIVRGVRIPVIDMFEAVARECSRLSFCDVLILGTALTMRSSRLREVFAAFGIKAAGPSGEDARLETTALIDELQTGIARDAPSRLSQIARAAFSSQFDSAKPVACLACTELPLAFLCERRHTLFEHAGVVYLNTSVIHVNALLDSAR